MNIRIDKDRRAMSEAAAQHAAASLREAIERTGKARVVAATGASQLDFLSALTATPGIAWPRVELFHLDEYIGLPAGHPASFRRYLRERLIDKTGITTIHFLDGEGEPRRGAPECRPRAVARAREPPVRRHRRRHAPGVQLPARSFLQKPAHISS